MKKNMRKLIPAICMLMISAMMLSTSSFAWFSMNTSVTATGMQVKAAAGGDLLISKTNATEGFKTTVDLSVENNAATSKLNLAPASTGNTLTTAGKPTFYILNEKGDGMVADSYEAGDGATFKVDDANYWTDTVWVMSSVDAQNLVANISIPKDSDGKEQGGTHALDPSLRMMLVVSQVGATTATYTQYIYAPVENATQTYKPVIGAGEWDADNKTYTTSPYGTDNVTLTSNGASIVAGDITASVVYQIDIYVWYEGQDASCMSANAYSLTNTTFDIAFSVSAKDATPGA